MSNEKMPINILNLYLDENGHNCGYCNDSETGKKINIQRIYMKK